MSDRVIRVTTVSFRVTLRERDALHRRAAARGVTLSEHIRDLVLRGPVTPAVVINETTTRCGGYAAGLQVGYDEGRRSR